MSTVWLIGSADEWQDEFSAILSGFFGIRRVSGLVNFGRLTTIAESGVDQCSFCIVRLTENDQLMTIHSAFSRYLRENERSRICVVGDLTSEQRQLVEALQIANLGMPYDMVQTAKVIKSLIRPMKSQNTLKSREDLLRFGDVEVNVATGRMRILAMGIDEPLTPKEIRILQVLSAAMNKSVARDELVDKVWAGLKVSDSTVDSHMSRLRKKFEQSFDCQLETKYGSGWVLMVGSPESR